MPQDQSSYQYSGGTNQATQPTFWPALIPSLILLAVAGIQIYFALTANLTPWKGGGFGMFSTNDHGQHRYLRVYVSALERTEEIEIPKEFVKLGSRVRSFPSEPFLTLLAKQISKKFRSGGIPVDSVQIEVWRIEYGKDNLAPKIRNLRKFKYIQNTANE